MKTERNNLLARLHILLKRTGAETEKEAIYASYNVASAAAMSDGQLMDLIGKLERLGNDRNRHDPELRAMRSEVLFVLTANPDARQPRRRGLGIPNDWQILNPFILRHAGKRLPDMDFSELAAFKKQLYAMRATGWRYAVKNATPVSHPTPRHADPVIMIGLPAQGKPVN